MSMPFTAGENIGPYRIIEQLGQGGMATVYKAYHPALDRYVALKVLHPAFLEDPNFLARFQREARLVAKLEHPHIVPIYDFAEHNGQPYLVMKFIEGETLKARLVRGDLTAEDISLVVEAVGTALDYAHRHGILHRDIKPSNVILSSDGEIYLADFGLARIAQSGESTLSSDMILGTPQYISPEQAMGTKDLDARTDIYSFGVMLYEMVVGRVPFSSDTPFSIIHDHIYSPLPLPREINPDISPDVERVLLKALAKDRNDRYESVSEMTAAFRKAWTGQEALPARRVPPPPREAATLPPSPRGDSATLPASPETTESGAAPARSSGKWGWIAAGLLLLILAGFVFFALRRPVAKPEPGEFSPPQDMQTEAPNPPQENEPAPNADPWDFEQKAVLLWLDGNFEESMQEATLAGDAAGEDIRLLRKMADDALETGAFPPAAYLYGQYLKFASPSEVPFEVYDALDESLYETAIFPEAAKYLNWEAYLRFNHLMGLVAQARYYYFTQDNEKSTALLDEAFGIEPEYPPALLLSAEIAANDGRVEDAKAFLEKINELAPPPPDWILVRAEDISRLIGK
jgi:serine/threonine protein kinase